MGVAFISYATPDAVAAEALCTHLDRRGVQTWIAPRDIPKGASHVDTIPLALESADDIVLVFSEATNAAAYVSRELDLAVGLGKRIIPIRLEDVSPSASLRYLIGGSQWIDAYKEATSVWRDHVANMILNPDPESAKAPQFHRKRNITMSPVMLLLAAIVLCATFFFAIFAADARSGESACSLEFPLGCLSDPQLLAGVFV